jgi:hypothetical protein
MRRCRVETRRYKGRDRGFAEAVHVRLRRLVSI